jgi:hypothetical protein
VVQWTTYWYCSLCCDLRETFKISMYPKEYTFWVLLITWLMA